ncbi:MAG TPA: proton-conducting transporter membrane subunit, partial [Ignavibacteriaceae bacterium]
LAYSTLSVLGTLTMLLGIGSNLAIKAFFIFMVAHSLYKGTLFLVAGTIDHETGTRVVTTLGGLKKYLPVTMVAALLASFSMMGIIPLVGFIGKETVYSAILEVENFRFLILALAVISNAFVVMVTILVGLKPFFGNILPTPKSPHEAPLKMLIGPIILAAFGLLSGLFPNVFIQKLLDQSTISIISEELGIEVKLWHGFNFVLLLSFVTLALGISIYYFRKQIIQALANISLTNFIKPSYWYERIFNGTLSFGKFQTKILQNGYLRYYIIFIILTTLGLAEYALFQIPL